MYKLTADENPEVGSKRIIFELIDENISLLRQLTPTLDEAVHESRKNLKRIRAVLRLIRDEIGETLYRQENIRFRDISRVLAPLRDGAVMVEAVDLLQTHHKLPAKSFARTRALLVEAYNATRSRFEHDKVLIDEVLERLEIGRQRVAALPFANQDFSALHGGVRRVYRRGRRRMASAYAHPGDPERFHDWRKRVKYLWYQLELLVELWPVVLTETAQELKHISTYLGDANDLAVLRDTLSKRPDLFRFKRENRLLQSLIAARSAELQKAAWPLGQRIYAETPRQFVGRLSTYWDVWQTHGVNGLVQKPEGPVDLAKQLITAATAADLLGISRSQVRQRIRAGHLPAVKIGGVWLLPKSALE